MDKIDNIINTIEKASTQFGGSLSATEKNLFNEVMNLAKNLKTNSSGNISASIENLKLINSIKGKLNKIVLNKSYLSDVKDLVSSFDSIAESQNAYFSTLTDKIPNESKYKYVQQMAVDNTVDMLAGAGIKANVTGLINEMLLKSVTSGLKYSDLTNDIKNLLTKTDTGDGALTKYARTYSETALNQFAGQNNKLLTDDLGLEWFMYVGSNKETTREFCELLTKKKYIHISEIPEILKGYIDGEQCKISSTTDLPLGLIEGTNEENFQVYCGGWNCGHKLIPVSKNIVPKQILSIFEQNNTSEKIMSKANPIFEQSTVKYNKEELYRGDLRDKGNKFTDDDISKDYNIDGDYKNKANFHWFTSSKEYATEYATKQLNESRGEIVKPTITTIKTKELNILDIENMSISQQVKFMGSLYDSGMKNMMYKQDKLSGVTKDLTSKELDKLLGYRVGTNILPNGQSFSDFDNGVLFKKWLKDNGFDGYKFKMYKYGDEIGLISKDDFEIKDRKHL